jgi:hypothetical protein
MTESTPDDRVATRLSRLRVAIENLIFRRPDLDALVRGWEVHRPSAFRRIYRDPRWHSVVVCIDCRGTGLDAAHTCSSCGGRGTLRLADADAAVVR